VSDWKTQLHNVTVEEGKIRPDTMSSDSHELFNRATHDMLLFRLSVGRKRQECRVFRERAQKQREKM
jgi:hypothetical protein